MLEGEGLGMVINGSIINGSSSNLSQLYLHVRLCRNVLYVITTARVVASGGPVVAAFRFESKTQREAMLICIKNQVTR